MRMIYIHDHPLKEYLFCSAIRKMRIALELTTIPSSPQGVLVLLNADPTDIIVFDFKVDRLSKETLFNFVKKQPHLNRALIMILLDERNHISPDEIRGVGFDYCVSKPALFKEYIRSIEETLANIPRPKEVV